MKELKDLIQLLAHDYKDAKQDMEKNDPNAKWLLIAVVVLVVLGGIIETM